MKKNQSKPTWEDLQKNENVYMPEGRFSKAYNKTMRYIINKTNLQTAMFYYVLYSHYNSTNNSCFPDQETLSIECGVSLNTIKSMVKALKEEGIINYKKGKQGRCNSYTFPLEPGFKKTNEQKKIEVSNILDDIEW